MYNVLMIKRPENCFYLIRPDMKLHAQRHEVQGDVVFVSECFGDPCDPSGSNIHVYISRMSLEEGRREWRQKIQLGFLWDEYKTSDWARKQTFIPMMVRFGIKHQRKLVSWNDIQI